MNFANMLRNQTPAVFVWALLCRISWRCSVCEPRDMRAMIFQLFPCHISLMVCVVLPPGYKIIGKVNLSHLSYVICLSSVWPVTGKPVVYIESMTLLQLSERNITFIRIKNTCIKCPSMLGIYKPASSLNPSFFFLVDHPFTRAQIQEKGALGLK